MAVQRRAIKSWTVCFSCGSAIRLDTLWIDDELLCRECAFRRMIERLTQSGDGDPERRDERTRGFSNEELWKA